jgi:ACS family glucarate transporter-like MFS transporter
VPLYFGAVGNWLSGLLVDALYRRGRRRVSRLGPAVLGFALGAGSLLAAASAPTVGVAVFCFSLATFGVDMTLSPGWTACQDIAGAQTGVLTGAMNMAGNIGSFISSVTFPWLVQATGGAAAYFYVAAAMNVAGLACWFRIAPRRDS